MAVARKLLLESPGNRLPVLLLINREIRGAPRGGVSAGAARLLRLGAILAVAVVLLSVLAKV